MLDRDCWRRPANISLGRDVRRRDTTRPLRSMVVMNLVIPTIELLAPYEAGKPLETLERELGVTNAIKLASNENPLGPSPRALQAVERAMCGVHRYPDSAAWALRERLSSRLGVPMNEIIHGNGSSEVLDLALRTFVGPEQHVIFADPSFVMYKAICLAAGAAFSAVPLRALTHDLEAMLAAVTAKTRLMSSQTRITRRELM